MKKPKLVISALDALRETLFLKVIRSVPYGLIILIMLRISLLLTVICAIISVANAQDGQVTPLEIGDAAPQLSVGYWLKGEPIKKFERGTVYVIEFWATWCKPCIAAMPHLSELAVNYGEKVVFLGIDIYERKSTTISKLKTFVDSIGLKWAVHVGAEDSNFMERFWLDAAGVKGEGIPLSVIVDAEGKIAWLGHPHELDKILPDIVKGVWDISKASADRKNMMRMKELELNASFELAKFDGDPTKPDDPGKPDSALAAINELVRVHPMLKYSRSIAAYTFVALLKTNASEACEYGKELLAVNSFLRPIEYIIINNIKV